jgi:hypothetical protein
MHGAQDIALHIETPKELTVKGAWINKKSNNKPSSSACSSNVSWQSSLALRESGVAIAIGCVGQKEDIVS